MAFPSHISKGGGGGGGGPGFLERGFQIFKGGGCRFADFITFFLNTP